MIFDLDGVLVDSNHIAERHWQMWAEQRGISVELISQSHHGRPTAQTMQEFAPHLDIPAEAHQKESAEADDTAGLVAFPGAHRILAALPSQSWAIVTSGMHRTALTRLQYTVLPVPSILVTADDVTRGKPDPEPYLRAIQQLGIPAGRCLVFEDAPAGVKAARGAGAIVVGITTTNPRESLSDADATISSLDDIRISIVDGRIQVQLINAMVRRL